MEKFSTNKLIGKKIKALREKSKLTQIQLAEELSIHPKHLSNIENGRKSVTIAILDRLSAFFNEPHFYFFDFTKEADLDNGSLNTINAIVRLLKSTDEKTRKNIVQIIAILTQK